MASSNMAGSNMAGRNMAGIVTGDAVHFVVDQQYRRGKLLQPILVAGGPGASQVAHGDAQVGTGSSLTCPGDTLLLEQRGAWSQPGRIRQFDGPAVASGQVAKQVTRGPRVRRHHARWYPRMALIKLLLPTFVGPVRVTCHGLAR